MESGAKGCEVIVTGKLRAARAKAMKFKDGYMISSGQPCNEFIDSAVRHVLLRQGVLGIKVSVTTCFCPAERMMDTHADQLSAKQPIWHGIACGARTVSHTRSSLSFVQQQGVCHHFSDSWTADETSTARKLLTGALLQVKIMRPHDPAGKIGPKAPLPDVVVIHEPKEEEVPAEKGYTKEEDMY
jgi:hypothetical protein